MRQSKREKLIIMAISFVLFAAGVFSLRMEPGALRTITLAGAVAGMLAIALRQSFIRIRKPRE